MVAERRDQATVLEFLEARRSQIVELARELIATPSVNPPGDERAVVDVLRRAMCDLGYERTTVLARDERRPNLLGEIGSGSPALLLNGHMDTQPPEPRDEWATDPFDPVVVDGRLYGVGAADMKGSVAAMVYAGAALREVTDLRGTLKVLLTADEESGSHFGARYVAEQGLVAADAAIVGEAAGVAEPWEWIGIASRGTSRFRLRVKGTQLHSGLRDHVPSVNAAEKAARLLVRLADEFRPRFPERQLVGSAPSVNPVILRDELGAFSTVPGEAVVGVDLRTSPGMSLELLEEDLERFLTGARAEDPELDVTIDWVDGMQWFPPCELAPDDRLSESLRRATARVFGRALPFGVMPAFTDGSQWAAAGIPTVPALGPGALLNIHRPNEWVGVDEIVDAAKIFALAALDFLAS
jgi:acetylornithine deacetylase/succinyl-diaminopimelate desuccinylase-like protein